MPIQQFFSYIWWEQVNFQWDDDDEIRFVLDQHAELEFYSASSLKQHPAGRHVAPLGQIIQIPSQPLTIHKYLTNFKIHHVHVSLYRLTTR